MKLALPQMLWLFLILVLPLVGFLWWAWRKRQQLITQFISTRLLAQLKVGVSPVRQKARMAMIVASVIFLILALARPQWGVTKEEVRQRGLDIIVAIDTSNSMLAEDVPPNRLQRAKLAALDLVHRAKTDRLGLVAFAGTAFLQCPLTLDDAAFSQSVDSLDTATISQGGTAIAEAINEARTAFKHESDNHRVLVLFTDGEDQDSEAVAAAEKAAKEGMIIFTVGIGTPEGELLRIRDERGRVDYIRDDKGTPVKSHLNEDLLQQIANAAKGFYLPLRGTKTMDTLYDRGIAPLPKSENSAKMFQRYHERFHWPLAIAMAFLILEMFLPDRKRKRSTRPNLAPKTAGAVAETVALLFILLLPMVASAGSSGALREYNDGKYQESLKDYQHLLESQKDDPRLHFNAGAAAYQSSQLEEAAKQFNDALASPDLQMQQRAYYNLGNTLYRLGQKLPDASAKQKAWENCMKNYENALKLNQQDPDAKFNQEFVKKQLEELKQQQQQSQSNGGDKDKSDQQKQQQDKDQKNQDKKDSQKNQDKNSQSQDDKDKSQQNKDSKSDGQKDDKQSNQDQQQQDKSEAKDKQAKQDKPDDKKQSAQNQGSGEPKEQSPEEAEREAAMMAAGQMTPKEARQLLDAQKDDDQVLRLAPPNKNTSQSRPFKNW
ncbi:MAG: Mg-chelatase subunit ChlD [Pedosphaera sp.]|nr:Mg-chelatase subunit ChlD [Pedosphaera sp.]